MLQRIEPRKRLLKRRQFPAAISNAQEFDVAVNEGILNALLPMDPFITRDTPIVTFGSCFAGNIARDLAAGGYKIHYVEVSERLFSAFALQNFVDGIASPETDLSKFVEAWHIPDQQIAQTRAVIGAGAIVIITFGLSFVWFDNETDEIIFDPTRVDSQLKYIVDDPERYEMRATDIPANFDAMVDMINGLRRLNPFTKVVLTLSPVPVHRAICDYPVMVADSISKATLRCALHQVSMLRLKDVYYFPSYEILRGLASMLDIIWFEDDRLNHVQQRWIAYTMSKFKAAYCVGEQSIAPPLGRTQG